MEGNLLMTKWQDSRPKYCQILSVAVGCNSLVQIKLQNSERFFSTSDLLILLQKLHWKAGLASAIRLSTVWMQLESAFAVVKWSRSACNFCQLATVHLHNVPLHLSVHLIHLEVYLVHLVIQACS